MIATWTLVLLLHGSAVTTVQGYESQAACMEAAKSASFYGPDTGFKAFCVRGPSK